MKCPQCPVRSALDCVGETHSPVCRDVEAGMPGRAAQLVALAEGPGPLAMAANFAGAVVAHIADGGRLAPPGVQAGREAECRKCPHHDHHADSCLACGCGVVAAISFVGLDLKFKRSWASSRCPDNPPRWTPV